jgi:hypothetical protein
VGEADIMKPDYAQNMHLVGHSDQGGRRDGIQVMVENGFAYIGHLFSQGFSIVDVRNPKAPKAAGYLAAPANTWNVHLQLADHLLLVIHGKDVFADAAFTDEASYYKASAGAALGTAKPKAKRDWDAGLAVYDVSTPGKPRRIGFMPVSGGIHRIWWTGGRWAYVSALLDGFSDFIFMTVDMSDPANPREAGRYWLPGMNLAAGETPTWGPNAKYGLHHAIVSGNTAWGAWRDAGLMVMDVADRAKPKLVVHLNWSPPFQGGTHNCLPLIDRNLLVVLDEAVLDDFADGLKNIWIFDVEDRANPIPVATMPVPQDAPYAGVARTTVHTTCTRIARARSRARRSFSPPGRTPGCASSTSRTSTGRRRSGRSFHRRRSASWTSARARNRSSSPATYSSTRRA